MLTEINDLKRIIKERVFDVSGEGENTMALDQLGPLGFEMSFNDSSKIANINNKNSWKSRTTKII